MQKFYRINIIFISMIIRMERWKPRKKSRRVFWLRPFCLYKYNVRYRLIWLLPLQTPHTCSYSHHTAKTTATTINRKKRKNKLLQIIENKWIKIVWNENKTREWNWNEWNNLRQWPSLPNQLSPPLVQYYLICALFFCSAFSVYLFETWLTLSKTWLKWLNSIGASINLRLRIDFLCKFSYCRDFQHTKTNNKG